jgi:hypothetical protein
MYRLTIIFILSIAIVASAKVKNTGKPVQQLTAVGNNPGQPLDSTTFHSYFANPPAAYRLIQYHMSIDPARQNDDVSAEIVSKFKSFGIGGLQQSVNYKNYLEDASLWNVLATNIDKAKAAGFRSWIHDEQGYPSGMAGGKIVRDNPELESLALIKLSAEATGLVATSLSQTDNITFIKAYITPISNGNPQYQLSQTVPIANGKASTSGIAGKWRLSVFGTKVINSNSQAQSTISQFGHLGRYPNLLDARSTQKYIEMTHQRYAAHVTGLSEKTELFYTGETNLQCIPWNTSGKYPLIPWHADLPQVFKSMHGYELWPYLDALFANTDNTSKMVRLHFYRTIGSLFSQNYSKPIANWCTANGVKALGHLLLEEYFATHVINYGDLMQVIQDYHVPMCDIPIPQPNWSDTQWDFWMPKLVSSAAFLQNKEMVAGLLDPVVMGNSYDNLTPDINRLKRTVNMAVFGGINQFASWIPLTSYYSPESFSWFTNYTARLCLMLRGARNATPVAMYYPIETFQANYLPGTGSWDAIAQQYAPMQLTHNTLAKNMLRNGMDYNYLTANAIVNAVCRNGFLEVGNHKYSTLLMPNVEVIPLQVLNKLIECQQKGVKVLWVGSVPTLGAQSNEHLQVQQISTGLSLTTDTSMNRSDFNPTGFNLNIASASGNLSVGKYVRGEDKIYMVVNDYGTAMTVNIQSAKTKIAKIYLPSDGSSRLVILPYSLTVNAYESVFLLESDALDALEDKSVVATTYTTNNNPKQWQFEPVSYLIYNTASNNYLTVSNNNSVTLTPRINGANGKNQVWTIEEGIYGHILLRNQGTGLVANNYCSDLNFNIAGYQNATPIVAAVSTLSNTGGSLHKLDDGVFFPQPNQLFAINTINWYNRTFVANTTTNPHSVVNTPLSQVANPKEWLFEEVPYERIYNTPSLYYRIKNTTNNHYLTASSNSITVGLQPVVRNSSVASNQVWTVQPALNDFVLLKNMSATAGAGRYLCVSEAESTQELVYLSLTESPTALNALLQIDNSLLKKPLSGISYPIYTSSIPQRILISNSTVSTKAPIIRQNLLSCFYQNGHICLRGIINPATISVYNLRGIIVFNTVSENDIDIPVDKIGLLIVSVITDWDNSVFKIATS